MIFLDNAGTTKMMHECVEVHELFSCENFFNPSAMSVESAEVSKLISNAQKFFLKKLDAQQGDVLFTGCATESNNLAIKGSLRTGKWKYVFSEGEHPSVYNVAKKLQLQGYDVCFVPLDIKGRVSLEELEKVLDENTRFISIMHVSNETGAINDIEKISQIKMKKCPKALLHVDGVQGFMKIPFSLRKTAVDLYSFSAHKIYGPKGIAGLYVKNTNSLKELFEGGGQQFGLRSGTENVSGIMQFKKAVEMLNLEKNLQHVADLKFEMIKTLSVEKGIEILDFKGSPYILNVVFDAVKGETMLHALNQAGVVVGLGSACSAKKAGNRILEKIGLSKEKIISSVRLSFSCFQSIEEIEEAGNIIVETYKKIKEKVS